MSSWYDKYLSVYERPFNEVPQEIIKGTRERLSPTTLKRLWGYLKNENVNTRPHTLNVLARFVGYKSFDDFCENACDTAEPQRYEQKQVEAAEG